MANIQGGNVSFDNWQAQKLFTYGGGARRRKGKATKKTAQALNEIDFEIEFDYAMSLFTSRFRWECKDLDWVLNGTIERFLFLYPGMAAFRAPESKYGVEKGTFLVLPAAPKSWTVMYTPSEVQAFGWSDGQVWTLKPDQYVWLQDNNIGAIPFFCVSRRADVVSDLGRAAEIYSKNMKRPSMVTATDKNKEVLKKAFSDIYDNMPVIFGSLNPKALTDSGSLKGVVDAPVSNIAQAFHLGHNGGDMDALYRAWNNMREDMLMKIGCVNGAQSNKNQYQSEGELDSAALHSRLWLKQCDENRQWFCQQVRDVFGVTITATNCVKELEQEAAEAEQQEASTDAEVEEEGRKEGSEDAR